MVLAERYDFVERCSAIGCTFWLFVACPLLWKSDKAILPKGKGFKGLLLLPSEGSQ
jgi:hypothetical protein